MILKGDALTMPIRANSVDAVVCDPPYGLEFMGKEWDAPWKYNKMQPLSFLPNSRQLPSFNPNRNPMCKVCHKAKRGKDKCKCVQPQFDDMDKRIEDAHKNQEWHTQWLTEAYRVLKSGDGNRGIRGGGDMFNGIKPMMRKFNGDSGGASRFFYCAKASRGERNAGLEGMPLGEPPASARSKAAEGRKNPLGEPRANHHPTVKPIKLFEWLIKLVTRKGQIVLDPFIGSGTTAIATHNTGRKCIGIEKEGEYLEIAKRRIEYWENKPTQMEIRA